MRPIVLASIAGLLAACGSDSVAPGPGPGDGELQYLATTPTGRPLLFGGLSLTFPTDSTVAGTWQIHRHPAGDTTIQVGPQVGTGMLVGTRHGDTVIIELNPLNVDNNVGLLGISSGTGLRGTWTWITITGPRTSGPFTAEAD